MSLQVSKQVAPLVNDVFEYFGALSITITSANDQQLYDVANPSEPEWERQQLSALFHAGESVEPIFAALNERLQILPEVHVSVLDDQDWERSWLDQFKPIRVGQNLWVCPSWCEPVRKDEINLIVDPGLAFGTGSHETTQLCLEYIAELKPAGSRVIDFGCGSGILAIATLLLGAKSALGIDIDPRAVTTANSNASINDVENRFHGMTNEQFARVLIDKPENFKQGDLVIANILAQTLIELVDEIVELVIDGGMLLLSGILKSQADDVIAIYSDYFDFETRSNNDWVLLVGKPKREHSHD